MKGGQQEQRRPFSCRCTAYKNIAGLVCCSTTTIITIVSSFSLVAVHAFTLQRRTTASSWTSSKRHFSPLLLRDDHNNKNNDGVRVRLYSSVPADDDFDMMQMNAPLLTDSPPSLLFASQFSSQKKTRKSFLGRGKNPFSSSQDGPPPQAQLFPKTGAKFPDFSLGGLTPPALAWTFVIILALAECLVDDPSDFWNGRELGFNILDAAVPLTPTDAVAVTIGEVTAGVIAPFVSLAVVGLLNKASSSSRNQQEQQQASITIRDLGQAVADADFLVARAATQSIFQSLGLPPALIRPLSGLVALLPSQIVKTAAFSRDKRFQKELQKELEAELKDEEFFLLKVFQHEPEKVETVESNLGVEIFSDLLKWLTYGVLCVRYEGILTPLDPVFECAVFGVVANLGSQAYFDLMEAFFAGEAKRETIRLRSIYEWKSLYLSQGILGAALFGLYQWVQEPATQVVSLYLRD